MTSKTITIPLHGSVVCDVCNKDFTDSPESGGFIFGSYGYGPCCAENGMAIIRKYNEEPHIKATCPPNKSYADFIREYRGPEGDNITITTFRQDNRK